MRKPVRPPQADDTPAPANVPAGEASPPPERPANPPEGDRDTPTGTGADAHSGPTDEAVGAAISPTTPAELSAAPPAAMVAEADAPADQHPQTADATVPEPATDFVPWCKLVQSDKNVRRTDKACNLEGLAASILRLGLLQNLVVSRSPDMDTFLVDAGERRRLAIGLLISQGRLPEHWPVRVIFVDAADRTASSAAENDQREAMHPCDQFQAFHQLALEGWTIDAIADAFGVTALTVERRLALARAAPALLDLFRRDEIATDQLMALCATDEHELQVAVWTSTAEWNRNPQTLRRSVLSTEIDASRDSRVAFIGGLEVFVAAGGDVRRDLFHADGKSGFITDVALLERLVEQKLEAAAAAVRAEGWGWVEIWREWNYTEYFRLGHIHGTEIRPSPEAEAAATALREEFAVLSEEAETLSDGVECYDEFIDESQRYNAVSARMEAIDSELKTIARSRVFFEPAAMAAAGAVVGVEHGALRVERGLVRTADRTKAAEAVGGGAQAVTGGRVSEVPGRKTGQLPDVLARSLFGHRNLAAQSMTAGNPHVAKVLLAAWMVQTLRNRPGAVPVDLRIVDAGFGGVGTRTQHPIVDESGAARQKAFAGMGNELVAALPKKEDALWDALMKLDAPELDRIIAFAVASALSLDRKHDGFTGQLLDALGFEMANHFTPTAENYFGRVPKALIVQALRDAGKAGSDATRPPWWR